MGTRKLRSWWIGKVTKWSAMDRKKRKVLGDHSNMKWPKPWGKIEIEDEDQDNRNQWQESGSDIDFNNIKYPTIISEEMNNFEVKEVTEVT